DEVDFGATATNDVHQALNSTLAASTSYTLSVWAKAASGTPKCRFGFAYDGSTWSYSSDTSLSTSWARYSWTFTTGSGGTAPTASNAIALVNGSTGTNNDEYFWGVQLEQASSPGVYVRTTLLPVVAGQGAVSDGLIARGTTVPAVRAVGSADG